MTVDTPRVFAGARRMKPTLRHRVAIWENMLGTVNAMNDRGEVRYFDYDWAAAREFAGVDVGDRDLRIWRAPTTQLFAGAGSLRRGQWAMYIRRSERLFSV